MTIVVHNDWNTLTIDVPHTWLYHDTIKTLTVSSFIDYITHQLLAAATTHLPSSHAYEQYQRFITIDRFTLIGSGSTTKPVNAATLSSDALLTELSLVTIEGTNDGLLGGKGGFGALLRNASLKPGQRKTTNNSASRDLNGRRLRHVEMEEALKSWNPDEHKVDQHKLNSKFKNIKEGKMLEVKECRWGDDCKYMYKCKYSHPIQAARAATKHKLTHLATSFGDTETASDAQADSESITSAVAAGLAHLKAEQEAKRAARRALAAGASSSSSSSSAASSSSSTTSSSNGNGVMEETKTPAAITTETSSSSNEVNGNGKGGTKRNRRDTDLPEPTPATSSSSSSNGSDDTNDSSSSTAPKAKKKRVDEPAPLVGGLAADIVAAIEGADEEVAENSTLAVAAALAKKAQQKAAREAAAAAAAATAATNGASASSSSSSGAIDLKAYASLSELTAAVSDDAIKAELTRVGMKAGGRADERAERLWLLRDTTIDKIPKKHLAAAKK